MIGLRSSRSSTGRVVLAGHDAVARSAISSARNGGNISAVDRRLFLALTVFAGFFVLVGLRLVVLAVVGGDYGPRVAANEEQPIHRPDIVDRNGDVIATDIMTASLYADGRAVIDPRYTAQQVASVLPDLNVDDLARKLETGRPFIWVKRDLTPKQQYAVHYLGMPGLGFRREQKRVYPNGSTASHLVGMVDLDNHGIAGIERYLDREILKSQNRNIRPAPVALSVDLRAQYALRDELEKAMAEFSAKAAAGVIMDVHTGEVVALSSLPDFDPNNPMAVSEDGRFNRATLGVYELGSVFKAVTLAAALDSGKVQVNNSFDATKPIKVARFTISDFHAENRWLTVPEVFVHSSNIGTAKIALMMGKEEHRDYLRKFGLLSKLQIEVPEAGTPLVPARWTDLATITVSFGHGIAVTPVQVVSAVSTIVNGGRKVTPTFLRMDTPLPGEQVVSEQVSETMRQLLRMVVVEGTGKKADVAGYPVMGKTGTAEKAINGVYVRSKLITSFISSFPAQNPRYAMIVMFDEPKATKDTYGYATAGWNAAPVTARVIKRVAPLLGVEPEGLPDLNQTPGMREAKLVSYGTESQ